jgi:nicotinate-nucleotide--dimethylbenzimidazole phosphoribosyltransferase
MVHNFLNGGAAVNVLSRHAGARVLVVDIGVSSKLPEKTGLEAKKIAAGTKNMAHGPAMDREKAVQALQMGFDLAAREIQRGVDLLGLGEMGIGNTTASSAITAVVTGEPVAAVTGRGTGLDDSGMAQKIKVIEGALEVNQVDPNDPMDILAKVGGFEIGGMAGAILAAAQGRVPVLLDGFITGAAALIAVGLAPQASNYLIASHRSVEVGHGHILAHLGLEPLFDLDLRLGEGTGAVLAMNMVEAAAKILDEMATFEEAGISGAEE